MLVHNIEHLIKEPVYFKNLEKPATIDLILTNKPKGFQHLWTFETGISDFQKMTIRTMKTLYKKQGLRIVSYRNYKNFDGNVFKKYLKLNLEKFNTSEFSLEDFQDTPCLSNLLGTTQLTEKNVKFSKIFWAETSEQIFHRGLPVR